MDKIKELLAQVPKDYLIAAAACFVLLLIEPVLAILAGAGFVLYKTGKLDRFLNK